MNETKKRILCVDDDPDCLEGLRIILEAKGYEVLTAEDGAKGMAVFRKDKPDAVIVDLMMEEIDAGVALARQIRGANAKIPVYMLSSAGDGMAGNINPAELGIDGVWQKPVDGERVATILAQRLN